VTWLYGPQVQEPVAEESSSESEEEEEGGIPDLYPRPPLGRNKKKVSPPDAWSKTSTQSP
jgi:hypothetical protein